MKPNRTNYKIYKSRLFRVSVLLVVTVILVESALMASSYSPIADGALIAAEPTVANASWNGVLPTLPNSKEEAQKVEKQYSSPFNFNRVMQLDKAYLNSTNPKALAAGGSALNQSAPITTPLAPTPTPGYHVMAVCTGIPNTNDNYEPDNTAATAKTIQVATAQNHSLDPATDEDWVTFTAQAGRNYTITAESPSTETFPAIFLLDSSANVNTPLAADNGSGTTSASYISSINFTATTTGTYYVRVILGQLGSNSSTASCGTYTLSLTLNGIGTTVPATSTPGATPTLGTCQDRFESDNSPSQASLLKPSQSTIVPFNPTPGLPTIDTTNDGTQFHYSCPAGDVDWEYFDLVKGKTYSVFTSKLQGGIDTFMVLYQLNADGSLKPIYSSDDYPGAGLASRIDWVVPFTTGTPLGEYVRYYLAVKDVAGHGTDLMSYNLTLAAFGNGIGTCFDAYESDNTPNNAKEILINETQTHTFCPDGDTDWVRFYAKAGRVYSVGTSFSGLPAAGIDTSLFVWAISFDTTDPSQIASQVLIGQNDDRSDGDLSSQVNFGVPSDGIYYAEVRNTGDRGRNGMSYQLTFSTGTGVPTTAPTTTAATTTAAATAAGVSVNSLSLSFGDPGFMQVWDYTDLAVLSGRAARTWMWGSPGLAKTESYAEAPGGSRQVQYFDKSRMEINNPKSSRDSQWFVSNGLLVREMILGKIATGNSAFLQTVPNTIPIAGDLSSANPSPSYQSFSNLITVDGNGMATDRSGQTVTNGLTSDGNTFELSTAPVQVKLSKYVTETGHNIPDVFWNYLTSTGTVFNGNSYIKAQLMDWVYVMGLPLSEPYWIKAVVGGQEKDVMVQVFERRILTFTPSNSAEWQVEMGNVGQHYFQWRYGRP
ncbi:MAG: PPC domain-containing protein [Chloroflexi bacterium]|uniref:PPC domain-containing protein n=1 Tax=Candidatus Chlorohelix allophototropha TaxID=3003348 RepID=A0A8T7M7J2_9CHLR|nr:PPC domain-containing protein [Chloroflexota bacterium]WJW68057.1 PPC domain-containing protein [Chloroflexota bacterium L227-S17]